MAAYTIGNSTIVHKDSYAYIAHPSIVVLQSGEWIAAFNHSRRRERRMHPPGDPLFRNLIARTSNRGETWEEPYFAPDFDWYGVECPGIAQLSNGTVVLTQFRFGWHNLVDARNLKAAGQHIYLSLPNRGWTEDFNDEDWDNSQFTWARGYHGLYAHLSTDHGYSFESSIKIDCGPYRDGYTRTGVVELSDGRVAYAITEVDTPHDIHTYIVFSGDGGRTWTSPVLVAESPDYTFDEPDVAEVAPGEFYCILRNNGPDGNLHGCRSADGGQTWSSPEPTPMFGHPGQLLVLRDGRLLCSYGRRKPPFGIRACISEDGGRTWQIDREIVVRDDMPNGDLGYPTTIEYGPGLLFCCYYGQEPDGITSIQGTYLTLSL